MEVIVGTNGQQRPLCDKHWGMVATEDNKISERTRKSLGIPIPTVTKFSAEEIARFNKKPDRIIGENGSLSISGSGEAKEGKAGKGTRCAVPDCNKLATLAVRGVSLCNKCWKATRSSDSEKRWAVREALGWNAEAKAEREAKKEGKKKTVRKGVKTKTETAAEPSVPTEAIEILPDFENLFSTLEAP
jgi:hypothetical protein